MTADITIDIDSLHAALDLDPADQETRRVLSDACEDAGDDVMAEGLRWMAAREKYPDTATNYYPDAPTPWRWDVIENGRDASSHWGIDAADLDYDAAFRTVGGVGLGNYTTRRAAEEALCRALAGMRTVIIGWDTPCGYASTCQMIRNALAKESTP